jgi:hypothetical protein
MANAQVSAEGRAQLELRLGEQRQLFDSMDPAPFHERDLDPKASDYIVGWAEETPKGQPLSLLLHTSRQAAAAGDEALLGEAVREFYKRRAAVAQRELSQLFRVGRISLVIGLAFLAGAIVAADALAAMISKEGWAWLVKESLIIGGWVALWRPIEIFLYDWWPIRARARLYDRLGAMQVRLLGEPASKPGVAT